MRGAPLPDNACISFRQAKIRKRRQTHYENTPIQIY